MIVRKIFVLMILVFTANNSHSAPLNTRSCARAIKAAADRKLVEEGSYLGLRRLHFLYKKKSGDKVFAADYAWGSYCHSYAAITIRPQSNGECKVLSVKNDVDTYRTLAKLGYDVDCARGDGWDRWATEESILRRLNNALNDRWIE